MSDAPQQLYAVLVALQGDTLLLPNLAVSEVVSLRDLRALPGAPLWFAGLLELQGSMLPVLSFELLGAGKPEIAQRRSRVVVLNSVSTRIAGGRYGLLAEGHPHLITLNRAALRPAEARPGDSDGPILARVRIASTEAAIPDLGRIEAHLASVLAQTPSPAAATP